MAPRDRDHLVVPARPSAEPFRLASGGGDNEPAAFSGDRSGHGRRLKSELETAVAVQPGDVKESGVLISFESAPGLELALESFDVRRAGDQPELRGVRIEPREDGESVQVATVFVPDGKRQYFVDKIEAYIQSSGAARPKNAKLVDAVASIRRATLRELWTDPIEDFPTDASALVWWEVWLTNDGGERERFTQFAEANHLQTSDQYLGFADRTVALLRSSLQQLSSSFAALDDLAELRRPHEVATFLISMSAAEQAEWVNELRDRLTVAGSEAPVVCVLDTGVQETHPLLADSLDPADSHQVNPAWGSFLTHGHGTEMAGLALFGDVQHAVTTALPVTLRHRLESVRILKQDQPTAPELYGAVTAGAVDLPEIQAPRRARVFLLAVSAHETAGQGPIGQPTAWSAAIDALAFGRAIDSTDARIMRLDRGETPKPRLFAIATGNIRDLRATDDHLAISDLRPVEDPGQAWNALTVGAYSDNDDMSGAAAIFNGYTPIAARGELSPVSRTSVTFDPKNWPFKPEVVADGGNWAASPGLTSVDTPDNLGLLTTRLQAPGRGFFTVTRDTSAATAQVAAIAADIHAAYPTLRPETVRALVVHSAEWTAPMRNRFDQARSRADAVALLRRYGMGVPDSERALRSASDALTLISESTIRPFKREGTEQDGTANEMNLHELPWPIRELEALGEAEVRLRITLSYFIEPNPSRRGWNGRWAYPSFGLRFAVKRPEDSVEAFRRRLNQLARDDGTRPIQLSTEDGWLFGHDQQKRPGSLHTDIWTGDAVQLALKGVIAVYPVSGWWKYRRTLDQSHLGAHYSLVVSIETPAVDIWTPVQQQIAAAAAIEVTT